jgi:putative tryptophan/tyrosine transport system substrate-binding protein
MKRREFITLIGGAAVAWPLTAGAQQPAGKAPTIGVLVSGSPSSHGRFVAAFRQRLRELGWVEGRTVAIEIRWAEGRSERFTEIAAELMRLKVDVIVTSGPGILAAKQATAVVPIVFASAAGPLSTGLVASLARPGGNVTGLSIQANDLTSKRLELLREVLPGLRRLAIMANVDAPSAALEMGDAQANARTFGLEVVTSEIRGAEDIAPAFEALKGRADALYVSRPARNHQPGPDQHLSGRRATADKLHFPGGRRSRWSDVLWSKHPGPVSARGRLCRQDSARDEAGRHPDRAAD